MTIRKSSIKAKLEKALEQLEAGRTDAAKSTLEGLVARLGDDAKAPKRKPGKYALYVKEQFPKMKKQYPDLDAPAIMKKIAQEYKK